MQYAPRHAFRFLPSSVGALMDTAFLRSKLGDWQAPTLVGAEPALSGWQADRSAVETASPSGAAPAPADAAEDLGSGARVRPV